MVNARDAVLKEVERMLDEVGMKASPFAKAAGVATTTLTRFMANPHAPVLSTSTMVRLRDARDRILAERGAAPDFSHFTKNAKKRAVMARLLTLPDDQITAIERAIENAIQGAPQAPPRKRNHHG